MGFESQGGESWYGTSPGGFEFGIQGWVWGPPVPKSITFFLDNTAMVCDQYGRQIRMALTGDEVVRFADSAPEANREGIVVPRPQFATHVQVIKALEAERINWLSYEVRWRARDGRNSTRGNLSLDEAGKLQAKLLKENHSPVVVDRTIACAGWPQLPYDDLKALVEVPPTPLEELLKIGDARLRKDAIRLRNETDKARQVEAASLGGNGDE